MIVSLNYPVCPIGKNINISMEVKILHFTYWRYSFFEVCTMDFWVPVVVVFYFRPRMRDILWECCTFNFCLAMISLENKTMEKMKKQRQERQEVLASHWGNNFLLMFIYLYKGGLTTIYLNVSIILFIFPRICYEKQ